MSFTWTFGARTHLGLVRTANEDAWFADPDIGAFGVADGMGGHAAGEVAARMAVEEIARRVGGHPAAGTARGGGNEQGHPGEARGEDVEVRPGQANEALRLLEEGIDAANRAILAEADRDPQKRGMGTTVTALLLLPEGAWALGHVGDSRGYLLRGGTLRRLTEDHTYVQRMVNQGRLTDEQARLHPRSSVLTRALGIEPQVEVHRRAGALSPGDRFLLCSDGLTGMLPERELATRLGGAPDPERAAEILLTAALEGGGSDNITVLVVDVAQTGDGA